MTTSVQRRRGTTSQHSTFTGLEGEITIDTTKDTAVVHDGSTVGGFPLAKESLSNVNPSTLTAITGAGTATDDLFLIYDASAGALKKITRAELNDALEQDALANVTITGGSINGTAIGGSTASTGAFTELTSSSTTTLNGTTIPASKTLLVSTDIGVSVQGYDADLANWALKAAPSGDAVGTTDTQTLTNKTINLTSNTLIGTIAQFNTALSDADFATLTGSESLSNKTITSSSLNSTPIGASSASTGAFTTLSASSTVSGSGFSSYLASPPAIGGTAAAAGNFTTLGASSTATLNTLVSSGATITGGSINGTTVGASTASTGAFTTLAYTGTLTGGTGVVNLGSGQFYKDASGNVGVGTASPAYRLQVETASATGNIVGYFRQGSGAVAAIQSSTDLVGFGNGAGSGQTRVYADGGSGFVTVGTAGTERMRIDSSGNVGIGTSSPLGKLQVKTQTNGNALFQNSTSVTGGVKINSINDAGNASAPLELDGSTLQFNIAASEKMRIDSSGNVGIGSVPTAVVNYRVLELDGTQGSYITLKHAGTEKGNLYVNDSGLSLTSVGARATQFYTNGAERMRIDSAGNVGIGTSSPSATSKLTIRDSSNGSYKAENTVGGTALFGVTSNASSQGFLDCTNEFLFKTDSTERMRIDSSGNLLVGTTNSNLTTYSGRLIIDGGAQIDAIQVYRNVSTQIGQIGFNNPNGRIGEIYTSGSTTAYATSSDYRLKEDIAPMTGALAKVSALKPVTYNWKVDGSTGQGFIAHELQEVVPDCVTGEKDAMRTEQYEISPAIPAEVDEDGKVIKEAVKAVMGEREVPAYQGIDTSFLVATLTAAIQEQQVMIEALTTRLNALEAK